jgi:hypothetical protein
MRPAPTDCLSADRNEKASNSAQQKSDLHQDKLKCLLVEDYQRIAFHKKPGIFLGWRQRRIDKALL